MVSIKCTPGLACRAFNDTTLVCFIANEHTPKCSRSMHVHIIMCMHVISVDLYLFMYLNDMILSTVIIFVITPKAPNVYTKLIIRFIGIGVGWINDFYRYLSCVLFIIRFTIVHGPRIYESNLGHNYIIKMYFIAYRFMVCLHTISHACMYCDIVCFCMICMSLLLSQTHTDPYSYCYLLNVPNYTQTLFSFDFTFSRVGGFAIITS